jgi:hypothetical protein
LSLCHPTQGKNRVKLFSSQLNDSCAESCRHLERFVQKYSLWLEEELQFSKTFMEQLLLHSHKKLSVPGPSSGHPVKLYSDCECISESRKRKVQQFLELQSPDAAEASWRAVGKRDAADV